MNIKIVLVHYGETIPLLKCLTTLGKQTEYSNIIISNNNSASLKSSLNDFKGIHCIDNEKNIGYAAGMNVGLEYALNLNPEYILMVTSDTTYEPSFLKGITEYAQKNKIDIVAPIIKDSSENIWYDGGEIDKNRYSAGHTTGRLDFTPGCCKLIKRTVFEKIGLLDEEYFMYYEDVDFDLRARRANFRIGIGEEIHIYHDTYHSEEATKNMEYYLARNHLYFVNKLAPAKVKRREMLRLPKTIYEHITRKQFDGLAGVKDFFLGRLGKRR